MRNGARDIKCHRWFKDIDWNGELLLETDFPRLKFLTILFPPTDVFNKKYSTPIKPVSVNAHFQKRLEVWVYLFLHRSSSLLMIRATLTTTMKSFLRRKLASVTMNFLKIFEEVQSKRLCYSRDHKLIICSDSSIKIKNKIFCWQSEFFFTINFYLLSLNDFLLQSLIFKEVKTNYATCHMFVSRFNRNTCWFLAALWPLYIHLHYVHLSYMTSSNIWNWFIHCGMKLNMKQSLQGSIIIWNVWCS